MAAVVPSPRNFEEVLGFSLGREPTAHTSFPVTTSASAVKIRCFFWSLCKIQMCSLPVQELPVGSVVGFALLAASIGIASSGQHRLIL
ncbi:hypothetical protein TrVGV298_011097 [Trichoderma virens]|nr:hypothetical protein TrVGV298_011097 [Trichoderma virens]